MATVIRVAQCGEHLDLATVVRITEPRGGLGDLTAVIRVTQPCGRLGYLATVVGVAELCGRIPDDRSARRIRELDAVRAAWPGLGVPDRGGCVLGN